MEGALHMQRALVRLVGVDALIDPSAKRPCGRRADVGIRPYGCGKMPRRSPIAFGWECW